MEYSDASAPDSTYAVFEEDRRMYECVTMPYKGSLPRVPPHWSDGLEVGDLVGVCRGDTEERDPRDTVVLALESDWIVLGDPSHQRSVCCCTLDTAPDCLRTLTPSHLPLLHQCMGLLTSLSPDSKHLVQYPPATWSLAVLSIPQHCTYTPGNGVFFTLQSVIDTLERAPYQLATSTLQFPLHPGHSLLAFARAALGSADMSAERVQPTTHTATRGTRSSAMGSSTRVSAVRQPSVRPPPPAGPRSYSARSAQLTLSATVPDSGTAASHREREWRGRERASPAIAPSEPIRTPRAEGEGVREIRGLRDLDYFEGEGERELSTSEPSMEEFATVEELREEEEREREVEREMGREGEMEEEDVYVPCDEEPHAHVEAEGEGEGEEEGERERDEDHQE
ncbi:hypothetical protein KIPB_007304 [Kipferlia bialata]|uniref:Uncharacterized protein n=1 Tax=Kipferlia bialata TaxID=797122 RepID=A0A9K3CYJ2_9EUKA|nr:hypothetical protein KIPB_007304 [Kipferlia bialata]|eukprot:g7304.t1